MVRLLDVCKVYENGTPALSGINLKIDDGEFVFLVGSSASGKSTIVKILTSEVKMTSGRGIVNGFNLNRIKPSKVPELRRTVGVVFQDFRLIDKMTVYENVAFAMRVVGAKNKELYEKLGVKAIFQGGEKNSVYPGEAEKEVHLKTCAQAFAMTKVVEKCSILFRDHTLFAHPKSRSYETQRKISQSLVSLLIFSNLLFLILGFIILAYFPEVRELPDFAHPGVLFALQACLVFLITIAYVEYWKKQDQRFPTLDRTII